MTDAIWVSIITAIGTVIGVWLTNRSQQKLMMAEFDKKLALIEQRISALSDEVREHNNFARRLPVVEEQVKELQRTRPS